MLLKKCYFSLFTELSLITLHWFLTLFASVVHTRILLRLWDLFFYEGSTVLFQVTLGMLKMKVCLLVILWALIMYVWCEDSVNCLRVLICVELLPGLAEKLPRTHLSVLKGKSKGLGLGIVLHTWSPEVLYIYSLGTGNWMAVANDTAAHYAAVRCPSQQTAGPTVHSRLTTPQSAFVP